MSIELTPEEQARLKARQQKEQALKEWKVNLAESIANLKITKTGAKNPRTLKKIKRKAKSKASNLLRSVDKGFIF